MFACSRKNMPEAIRRFCEKTGQVVPPDEGAVLAFHLESIAMKFRHVLGMCEDLVGGRMERSISSAGVEPANLPGCGRCLRPPGRGRSHRGHGHRNVRIQAVAAGGVSSIAQAREVIRRRFPSGIRAPQRAAWTKRTQGFSRW